MADALCTLLCSRILVHRFDSSRLAFPAAMYIADPVTGHLPIEKALLNVGKNESLENVDAVDALLRANPAFLNRIV